ncbi:hypothetical protein OsI_00238 [Oryza sativa Indica Group]|uniref:Transmembrane protein n=1 Tax=Oryza sativa subsp. indica TaxID=39946 RepID=A2WK89_ORYSI|nr:hypothetical protein OsI_00238 [Oryza sativa Indica Group]
MEIDSRRDTVRPSRQEIERSREGESRRLTGGGEGEVAPLHARTREELKKLQLSPFRVATNSTNCFQDASFPIQSAATASGEITSLPRRRLFFPASSKRGSWQRIVDVPCGFGKISTIFVEEMVAYCHADEYDYLRETCDSLRQFIADQRHHISQLSAQAEAKELQLQANYEALNQSKLGCADLKKKLECEKAWTRTIVSMMILFYVLLVAVMIRQV